MKPCGAQGPPDKVVENTQHTAEKQAQETAGGEGCGGAVKSQGQTSDTWFWGLGVEKVRGSTRYKDA